MKIIILLFAISCFTTPALALNLANTHYDGFATAQETPRFAYNIVTPDKDTSMSLGQASQNKFVPKEADASIAVMMRWNKRF